MITFITQPLWGLVGDYWGNLPALFSVLVLITGACISIFAFLPTTGIFYLLPILIGLFQGPLSPMLNSMGIRILGEGKQNWGLTRLWGSIGFATVSLLMGSIFALKPQALFLGYGLGSLLTAFVVFNLPFQPAKIKEKKRFSLSGLKNVLHGPFSGFLAAMFIVQLGQYLPSNFLSLVMIDRGSTSSLVGLVWSITALVEIPTLIGSGYLLKKYSPQRLLIWAGLFNALRLALFGLAFHPILMLIIQAFEGIAYATFLVCLVLIVDDLIPPEFHVTGFTLQMAFGEILPQLLAGLIGGQIYDYWGGLTLYFTSAGLTFFGVFAFVFWQRKQ